MVIRRVILVWLAPTATDAERAVVAGRLGAELELGARDAGCARARVESGVRCIAKSGFDLFATLAFADGKEAAAFDRAAQGVVSRACGAGMGGFKQYDFATGEECA